MTIFLTNKEKNNLEISEIFKNLFILILKIPELSEWASFYQIDPNSFK